MVSQQLLEQLAQIDSCTVSNAIEHFDLRTRNEGFVNGNAVHCIFPEMPPKVGFAVTGTMRSSSTPIAGRFYYEHVDWWAYVASVPAPKFVVIQDVDRSCGLGALFGEIHANIAVALGCVAYLSNGSVRDLPGVRSAALQVFAGSVAVSHSYAHVVQFGHPVEVGGLEIKPGDLLHGDQHGVVSVPLDAAPRIPEVAAKIIHSETEIVRACRSGDFSLDKLKGQIDRAARALGQLDKDRR
jgi:regulator of RNase E activity RraA